jgi:hypothetical protein
VQEQGHEERQQQEQRQNPDYLVKLVKSSLLRNYNLPKDDEQDLECIEKRQKKEGGEGEAWEQSQNEQQKRPQS